MRHTDSSSQVQGAGWTVGTNGSDANSAVRWAGVWDERHRTGDIRLTLPARPENVTLVRHVLTATAEALGLPRHVVDDLRLAVTEACTNVVRHAYAGDDGPLEITVRPDGDALQVVVGDQGRGAASLDAAGPGLGLGLIAALAHRFEVDHSGGRGRRLAMWFLRDGAGAPAEAR